MTPLQDCDVIRDDALELTFVKGMDFTQNIFFCDNLNNKKKWTIQNFLKYLDLHFIYVQLSRKFVFVVSELMMIHFSWKKIDSTYSKHIQ